MPAKKIEYDLFRVKFIKSAQTDMFLSEMSPSEIFSSALKEEPKTETRKDSIWLMGNIVQVDDTSGYLRIGRISKSHVSNFDEKSAEFVDYEVQNWPNTRILYDTTIGLIAIAHNSQLSNSTTSSADKLRRLLESTKIVASHGIDVDISIIPDPVDFFRKIRIAHSVLTFAATFTGPNPIDADEIFQKPLSHLTKEINGKNGELSINGEDLNREVVEELGRSTAATGNNGYARIRRAAGKRPKKIPIGKSPVQLTYSEAEHYEITALNDMRAAYKQVRHEDTDS